MAKIIAYENSTEAPIAFDSPGGRIILWKKGDRIQDKEGNPVTNVLFSDKRYHDMGLKPVYAIEPKSSAPVIPTTIPVEQPKAVTKVEEKPKTEEQVEKPINPLKAEELLKCTLDKNTEEWTFLKDGFKSKSPAGMKVHIKKAFGSEVLDKVEFVK